MSQELRNKAITIRDEKNKGANTAKRVGEAFLQVDVDLQALDKKIDNSTINDRGIYATLADLKTDYPDNSEKNKAGFFAFVGASNPRRKYKINVDKGSWIDTGEDHNVADVDLADYATKEDLGAMSNLSMCKNALNDAQAMKPTRMHGEVFSGATLSEDKKSITISTGFTGNNSYWTSVFDNTELIKVIKEAYINNSKSIYAALKYKVSDATNAIYLKPRIIAGANNAAGNYIAWIKDGEFRYLLFELTADISTLSSSLRVGVQFHQTAALTNDFTFEYVDSTFFIYDNSTYSSFLADKVSKQKHLSSHAFGTELAAYSRFNKFVGGIACNNTPTTIGGFLNSIFLKVSGTGGNMRFGIGFIDQRNWAIIRDEFSLKVVSGTQTINVLDKNLTINDGELIFVFLDDANAAPMFSPGTQEGHDLMLYNDQTADAALFRLATTYGGYITLSWTVDTINSDLFATKPEVQKVNNDLKIVNEAIIQTNSKLGTAIDYLGNRYDLRVVDGVVIPIPMRYKKALVIGNSITKHPIKEGVWWGVWGMAATKKEFDLVSTLEKGLKVIDDSATAEGFNVALWERNFNTDKDALFNGVLAPDTDLVIFRLGENVIDLVNFESAFDELVSYTISKCPKAKFVITGVFWTKAEKDIAMSNIAEKYGITFVKMSDLDTPENKIKVGDVVWGDDGLEHTITQSSGVAGHPNNLGQKRQGNRMLLSVDYKTID